MQPERCSRSFHNHPVNSRWMVPERCGYAGWNKRERAYFRNTPPQPAYSYMHGTERTASMLGKRHMATCMFHGEKPSQPYMTMQRMRTMGSACRCSKDLHLRDHKTTHAMAIGVGNPHLASGGTPVDGGWVNWAAWHGVPQRMPIPLQQILCLSSGTALVRLSATMLAVAQ